MHDHVNKLPQTLNLNPLAKPEICHPNPYMLINLNTIPFALHPNPLDPSSPSGDLGCQEIPPSNTDPKNPEP